MIAAHPWPMEHEWANKNKERHSWTQSNNNSSKNDNVYFYRFFGFNTETDNMSQVLAENRRGPSGRATLGPQIRN